jgi:hypothetical protein
MKSCRPRKHLTDRSDYPTGSPVRAPRQEFINHDQYRVILQSLPESLKPIFVVACHVPLQKKELLDLHCDQVDLAEKRLILKNGAKVSGEPRTAPIYGDMFAWLDMQLSTCKAVSPDGKHLFTDDKGKPITDTRKLWKIASQRFPNLQFRDLRRTATRKMVQSGFSSQTVMEAAGLKTASLLWRSTTTERGDIIAAGRLMQKYFDEEIQPVHERPSQTKPN